MVWVHTCVQKGCTIFLQALNGIILWKLITLLYLPMQAVPYLDHKIQSVWIQSYCLASFTSTICMPWQSPPGPHACRMPISGCINIIMVPIAWPPGPHKVKSQCSKCPTYQGGGMCGRCVCMAIIFIKRKHFLLMIKINSLQYRWKWQRFGVVVVVMS